MRRHLAGLISLTLLLVGGFLYFWPPEWENSAPLAASCIRIGAVLAAIWLAYPELNRLPGWLAPVCTATAIAIAVRPRLAIFIIPLAIVLLILRPRKKKSQTKRSPSTKQSPRGSDASADPLRKDRQ